MAITGPNRCAFCREPIEQTGDVGRPRLYCDAACKQAAHRRQHPGTGSWPVQSRTAPYFPRRADGPILT